jgi:hypothetical protein
MMMVVVMTPMLKIRNFCPRRKVETCGGASGRKSDETQGKKLVAHSTLFEMYLDYHSKY